MDTAKQTYDIVADGFLFGDFYTAGSTIELHPAQAKYDLPPRGSMLREPAPVVPASAPAVMPKPKAKD